MKSCKGIGKTKGHNNIFVKAYGSAKISLPLISLLDLYEVKGIFQVNNGETGIALYAVKEIINKVEADNSSFW